MRRYTFIDDRDDNDEDEENDEDNDELFDSVCAICDNGGELLWYGFPPPPRFLILFFFFPF